MFRTTTLLLVSTLAGDPLQDFTEDGEAERAEATGVVATLLAAEGGRP